MAKPTKKNSSEINILAQAGGRSGLMEKTLNAIALILLFAVLAMGCDTAKDKNNPASMGAGYGEVAEAVNSGDLENTAVDAWVDSPHLAVNLTREGETTPAYSGLFTIDTTTMTLSLGFADIKPGRYNLEKFGLPSCANLVDDANELVTKITIYSLKELKKLNSEVDGGTGFVTNDKVFKVVPDQACIDPQEDHKTELWACAVDSSSDVCLPDCDWFAQGNNGEVSQEIDEFEIDEEECSSFSFCDENTVAFELKSGLYTISVICGDDKKGSDMVDVPNISTPHAIQMVVHTELDEGELCSKRKTFSFGLNIELRDLSESIGRVKNGVCDLSEISDEARMAAVMSFDSNCSDNMTTGDLYVGDGPDGGTDGGTVGGDIDLSGYEFLNMVLINTVPFTSEHNGTGVLTIDGGDLVIDLVFSPHNVSK